MPALPARLVRPAPRVLFSAAALAVMAVPAGAQPYDRPYGRPYVQPYIDLNLNQYDTPGPADYNAPPVGLPPQDVEPMLRSMGMSNVGRVRAGGNIYTVDATDPGGMRQRVRIDANSARIIGMIPLGPDSGATRYGATPPGNGGWNPPPAAMNVPSGVTSGRPMPAVPPLPPARQPEFAGVPPAGAGAPAASTAPAGAVAPSVMPDTDVAAPVSSQPAGAAVNAAAVDGAVGPVDPGPGAYDPEVSAPAANAGDTPAPAANAAATPTPAPAGTTGPIRVIPGVAVPPGTQPAATPSAASIGAGTGTGAGEAAGEASVIARDGVSSTP